MFRHHLQHLSLRHLFRELFTLSLLVISVGATQQTLASPDVERSAKVDGKVYEIVFNPQDQRIYAAVIGGHVARDNGEIEEMSPGIVALNGDTLESMDKIDTGKTLPFGLALNRITQRLYATDTRHGTVGVYDIGTGKEIALIPSPNGKPQHVREAVVNEATNTIYVSVVGGFSRGDKPAPKSAVWVIDGKTNTLAHVINDPVKSATGLAIDTTNRRLYVSDLANNQVAEIDLEKRKVLRRFASVAKPANAANGKDEGKAKPDTINLEIDTENGLLYAVNKDSGGIAVIDLAEGRVVDNVKTGDGALSARLNPQTGDLYVANRGDGTVSVIDGKTRYVTAHLATGTYPQTVAIDPASGRVYVSNKAKGRGRHAPADAPVPYEPGGNTVTLIHP